MRKTNKTQKIILEELEKTGLVSSACGKAKIPRSTYYRWYNSDIDFQVKVDAAIDLGRSNMVDFAESKVIKNIQDGNQRAAEFYLRNNDSRYRSSYAREFQRQVEMLKSEHRKKYELFDILKASLFSALPKEVLLEFAKGEPAKPEDPAIDFRKLNEAEIQREVQRILGVKAYHNLIHTLMNAEGVTLEDLENRPPMPEEHEVDYSDKDEESDNNEDQH